MEYLGDYKLTLFNIDKNIIFEKYIKNEYFLRKFRNKCKYSKKIKILCEEKMY